MFLNPKEINGLLIDGKNPESSVVKLVVDNLYKIDSAFSYISNNVESQVNQGQHEVELSDSLEANEKYGLKRNVFRNQDRGWFLSAQQTYNVDANATISIPNGVVGIVLSKPELQNNAINVIQKILPSGYTGNISFILQNINGNTFLEKGTVVAELFFVTAPKVEVVVETTTTQAPAVVIEPEAPIAIVELPTEETIVETTTQTPKVAEETVAPRRNRPR